MENVILEKGKCSICNGPIEKEWAGENPSLGTKCQRCGMAQPEIQLFGPEHVDLKVTKAIVFDPLFGRYEYHFDWKGTRVKINDRIGTVECTYADSASVCFPGGEKFGTSIKELGYWDLRRIFKEAGGQVEPTPMVLEPFIPSKAELLSSPILPVEVRKDEDGRTLSVEVINDRRVSREIPREALGMFHAFCNIYVRKKFGLSPNFACEGGFIGRDFEVRNALFSNGAEIHVCSQSAPAPKDPRTPGALVEALNYLRNPGLAENPSLVGADVETVLGTWTAIMLVLLCFDWNKFCSTARLEVRKFPAPTEPLYLWALYCMMQNVLLNSLDVQELEETLQYARKHEMVHAGSSF